MDWYDRSQELEMATRNAAIAAQREKLKAPSLPECVNCGEAIPLKRQAIGGVTRCIGCQENHEKMESKYAR